MARGEDTCDINYTWNYESIKDLSFSDIDSFEKELKKIYSIENSSFRNMVFLLII